VATYYCAKRISPPSCDQHRQARTRDLPRLAGPMNSHIGRAMLAKYPYLACILPLFPPENRLQSQIGQRNATRRLRCQTGRCTVDHFSTKPQTSLLPSNFCLEPLDKSIQPRIDLARAKIGNDLQWDPLHIFCPKPPGYPGLIVAPHKAIRSWQVSHGAPSPAEPTVLMMLTDR